MKRPALPFTLLAVVVLISLHSASASAAEQKAEMKKAPADRVVVMYFHRTQRCPTCLRMGGYSEEAVVKGFAGQIKDGTVEFHYIDFQDKKNAALTKGYKIGGPTLIVARVAKNKVAEFTDLKDIWTKNSDKKAFFKYVRDSVTAYLRATSQTALKPKADTSAAKTKQDRATDFTSHPPTSSESR